MLDLYNYSLLTIFLIGLAAILAAIELGHWLGVRRIRKRARRAGYGRSDRARSLHSPGKKPLVETFNAEMLDVYGRACGWALARAHSKVSEISATISGYLGSSSDEFDEAMGKFALAYADQVERDYASLKAAARKGEVPVIQE